MDFADLRGQSPEARSQTPCLAKAAEAEHHTEARKWKRSTTHGMTGSGRGRDSSRAARSPSATSSNPPPSFSCAYEQMSVNRLSVPLGVRVMAGKLHDKTILITGASAGIGRASALALAQEGANLVLDRTPRRAPGSLAGRRVRARRTRGLRRRGRPRRGDRKSAQYRLPWTISASSTSWSTTPAPASTRTWSTPAPKTTT